MAPLSQRSPEADDRGTPGHWEADLMRFGNHGPVLLLLHERHSRLLLACRLHSKAAAPIAAAIARLLSPWPAELRRNVAFDNGTEFARHSRLHTLGIRTYFCDVRSPWQKGGVENAIGRLRRFLPRRFYQGVRLEANPGVGFSRRAASVPHAPAVPGLPDARRSIPRRRVALEM